MNKLKKPIGWTTFILLIYTIAPYLGLIYPIVFLLFVLLTGLLIWMVIRILKDGEPSGKKFDEEWYDH